MSIVDHLKEKFGEAILAVQPVCDGIPTVWVTPSRVAAVLSHLKNGVDQPYKMLWDLTAVDERSRTHRSGLPKSDFTVVYHLMSFGRNEDIRIKAPLEGEYPSIATACAIWPNANWYEREVFDMFGIRFDGHPCLRRILMPPTWVGHPLRKEHPARATEMAPYTLPDDKSDRELEALRFVPEEWGMKRRDGDVEYLFLNLGPHHPGTHGIIRFLLQLDGEEIVDSVLDIGYHHRGAEKMGERQSWHSYIPYTDRIDYVAGVLNNLAYVQSVEKMAGIQVPERAQVIRVMLCELFRIISHCVWYGTFAQDLGAMSPVLFLFNDREKAFTIIEAICGGRMHPSWFRIGGVAHDLPNGWQRLVKEFLDYMPARLASYDKAVMRNGILKKRTIGVGAFNTEEALDWGITGPGLRATGMGWDARKARPYSGYENYDFDVPVFQNGDVYDRARVRAEEMRQSLRIIEQCMKNMPEGPYKAEHPLTTPPPKDRTLHDIDTLINHFLGVSWGPVIPAGEACCPIEGSKGYYGYYLTSDGGTMSYRTRIRTGSFAHLQMVPLISRGHLVADMLAIVAGVDFVLADLDR